MPKYIIECEYKNTKYEFILMANSLWDAKSDAEKLINDDHKVINVKYMKNQEKK